MLGAARLLRGDRCGDRCARRCGLARLRCGVRRDGGRGGGGPQDGALPRLDAGSVHVLPEVRAAFGSARLRRFLRLGDAGDRTGEDRTGERERAGEGEREPPRLRPAPRRGEAFFAARCACGAPASRNRATLLLVQARCASISAASSSSIFDRIAASSCRPSTIWSCRSSPAGAVRHAGGERTSPAFFLRCVFFGISSQRRRGAPAPRRPALGFCAAQTSGSG